MKKRFRMVKTVAAVLLAVVVVMALASCSSSKGGNASDASGTVGALEWEYKKSNKTLTVSGSGDMKDFDASADAEWSKVRTSAETLTVEEGITSVGDRAFYSFTALKNIELPDSLTEIGDYSFAFCTSVETVVIPAGVTKVGDGAFETCSAMKSVYLPVATRSVGERAFAFCTSMETALITGEIDRIAPETFYFCTKLNKVVLNSALRDNLEVAENAFSGEGVSMTMDKVTFTDSETGASTITVKYVFKDGGEAAASQSATKKFGEKYSFVTPSLEGYTPDKPSVNGTANGTDVTITVTYEESAETTAAPETEPETEAEKEPVTAGTIVAIVVMVLVLVGIGVGAFLLIRSDKKQAAKKPGNKTPKK